MKNPVIWVKMLMGEKDESEILSEPSGFWSESNTGSDND
jgi:hypothetical protein